MASVDRQPVPPHQMAQVPQNLPSLRSNSGNYVSSESTGWMVPTLLCTSIEEMRARYQHDGYIWIKKLIPREDVFDMREHYFTQFTHTGMLLPGASPRDGIFDPSNDPLVHQGLGGTPEAENLELLDAIHASSTYRNFLAHPALRTFIRAFMGWKQETLLERAMLRHNCPGSLSTAVHYDHIFLRGGKAEFLTAWVPIGDCAPTGGGLMYLEDSSSLGEKIESDFARDAMTLSAEERINAFNKHMARDGNLSHDAEQFGRIRGEGKRWLVGDYEAGDVVFHRPYMVHAATKNEDESGRIRLSSDLRFYEDGAALDQRWTNVFRHDDGL